MKKLIYSALALVAGLFAASCQQEFSDSTKYISMVTYSVEIPDVVQTKSLGGGANINNLVYAVYRTEAETLDEAKASMSSNTLVYRSNPKANGLATTFSDGKAHVSIELINDQKYIILFWAQVDEAWITGTNFDLTNVVYPDLLDANDDKYSAFSGVSYIAKVKGTRTASVTLSRPFAQINIASVSPRNYEVDVTSSSVKICGVAASFNVATQTASETTTDVEYADAATPSGAFNSTYPHYIAMNYVFASGNVSVGYTINTDHGTVTCMENPISNVPVAKNHRTNIIGNLLSGDVDYSVTLESGWGEPNLEPHPLYIAAAVGGEYTLEEDVDFTDVGAPLVITSDLTLNLNGKTLKGGKAYDASAGMSGIDIAAISLDNGATLTIVGDGGIEGSSYCVYAKNGTLNIKNGTFTAETSAVQVAAATVNIEGGTFSNTDEDKRYTINCLDANWKNGTAKVNITGGTFIDFNPANNHAEGAGTNFCAEGYTAKSQNGEFVVVAVTKASNNNELADAIITGGIIQLTDDIEILKTIDIKAGVDVTLNLNGQSILIDTETLTPNSNGYQYAFIIREGGSLTIDGEGTVEANTPGPIMFYPAGDLVIESGSFIRHIPEGYSGNVGSMFVGTKPAGGWGSTGVTINGGYFDGGYYVEEAEHVDALLAGTEILVETEADINKRGQSGDPNTFRKNIKEFISATFNKSNNYFKVYGGTFVGANPAWGDEGCMLPTSPQYLRPWSYYQGSFIEGQTFNENGIVLPEGFTITKGTHEDGRPTYTVTYNKTN